MKTLKSCSTRFMCDYGSLLQLSSFLFCLDFWLPEELVNFLDDFRKADPSERFRYVVGINSGLTTLEVIPPAK